MLALLIWCTARATGRDDHRVHGRPQHHAGRGNAGLLKVPGPPVEARIALSIVFVATEMVHGAQRPTGADRATALARGVLFGLLHGFGFAGALHEVGLPEKAIPLALLFFNVGVEVGQLLFIAAVLAVIVLAAQDPDRAARLGMAGAALRDRCGRVVLADRASRGISVVTEVSTPGCGARGWRFALAGARMTPSRPESQTPEVNMRRLATIRQLSLLAFTCVGLALASAPVLAAKDPPPEVSPRACI